MKRSDSASSQFVDFGRWTAGYWTTKTPGIWFAVGYVYSRNEKPYGISGPAITIGRRTWAVCPLYSRAEHKQRKNDPWAKGSEEFQPLPRRRPWWPW
ncbi:hypothetical protein QR97_01880 [Streptomyces sp. PBH53]|uniref:hypothetical protein n=1 Tax=Streptomyces sp. PBH53 TaxID=1577075 RepID=UPI000654BC76|nr:hypothetical protein [Streptomyces sp. PBH53]AKN68717.1 hypothetical protein QR97_01880 [Streptomyces sp. PBH53]